MIADQIALLKSEERKLKKFLTYNKEAKPTVDIHLQEIQEKKRKLYNLCDMMGIDGHEDSEEEDQSVRQSRIPQPTGRFGSRLISWHS
ncbi:hypothetical protein GCM10009122_33820 [Fulvivirga kasyanovii]|uniref:hypothetical protein n=1 Tax=Fulvivirga kasyanovii TaxID=396812 RepID=UPI0031DFBAE8